MDADRSPGSRLTRRQTVQLGGAAAAGSVIGRFAGPRAVEAKAVLPWDVRDLVKDAELDPPHVQCIYDDINRLAFLVGDVRFPRVLGDQLIEVIPPIVPKVDQAALFGLFENPAGTKAKLTHLVEVGGELSVADLFTRHRKNVSSEVRKAVIDLWRDGVRMPFPATTARTARNRKRVMRRVIRHNRKMTFKSFYDTPVSEFSAIGIGALTSAKALGFLGWGDNDRCCKQGEIQDSCPEYTDMSCYRRASGVAQGFCTAASDMCPKPKDDN